MSENSDTTFSATPTDNPIIDDEAALAAAMVYIDLNPVRAGIANSIETSDHTSVQARANALRDDPSQANAPLRPIVGVGFSVYTGEAFVSRLAMSNRQCIELVDFTGRQFKPGKRSKFDAREPSALSKLGLEADQWTGHVKGIGSGYSRMVGSIEALQAKAAEWKQKWLRGIGYARNLVTR